MRMRRVVSVTCLLPLVLACGGGASTPTEIPDVRGSWGGGAGAWRWTDTYFFQSDTQRSLTCQGTIDITSQDGSAFGGRYSIKCAKSVTDADGPRSSGAIVGGQALPNGNVSFRLRTDEGFGPGVPPGWFGAGCQNVGDGTAYQGSLMNGNLDVSSDQNVTCPPGRVVVTNVFYGPRS